MNVAMRRGACPALSAPMQTGDGLLVRLALAEGGFAPVQLAELCDLARRHGNGIVEVTARGSFQMRGLTAASALLLEADVAGLDLNLRDGVPVETSPLAGLDPDEVADPLSLVRAIRAEIENAGLSRRLAPKVSVVVDGGGHVNLSDLLADVRLTAFRRDVEVVWQLAIGGDAKTARPVAVLDESDAAAAVAAVLETVATLDGAARGRDVADETLEALVARLATLRSFAPPSVLQMSGRTEGGDVERQPFVSALPLTDSRFAVSAGLPFGSIHAYELTAFLNTLAVDEIRLAPQRSLILICGTEAAARAALDAARALDLIADPADPRRAIAACPGAPACASGKIATRDIARRIAGAGALPGSVHVSGCEKGCAHPTPADLVLVGTDAGIALVRNGRASDTPLATVSSADAALALLHGNPA